MKKPFKLLSLLLAVIMMLSALAACGETETDDETGGGSQTGKVRTDLVIATANEPPTLHPYDHNASASNTMNSLTYCALMELNIDTLEPEPYLAKTVQPVSDTQWQITLREDVKFHNGEPVTAEDVKASMEWAKSDYSAKTSIYTSWWTDIEVKDELTLLINTPTPNAKATTNLSRIKVVPKSLIDSGNDFNQNPVGCGPYKFVEWQLGDCLVFEAYEDFFQGAPEIKKMTWRIIPEGSSRTIALEAGEVDFVTEVEANDIGRLESDKDITLLNQTGTGHFSLNLNNSKAPFDNQALRHGINCAIDKEAVVKVALNGNGSGCWVQVPDAFAGYTEENADSYNKELAQKYFDESGIDIKNLSFSCICSDDTKRRAAEVIQANLKEFGITMNLESMDLATYISATSDGNFESAIGSFTTSNIMAYIEGRYLSASAGGSTKTFRDDTLDSLYLNSITILDDDKRNAEFEKCVARLNEVCPSAPLYLSNNTRAYNSKLQGVRLTPTGDMKWQNLSWSE